MFSPGSFSWSYGLQQIPTAASPALSVLPLLPTSFLLANHLFWGKTPYVQPPYTEPSLCVTAVRHVFLTAFHCITLVTRAILPHLHNLYKVWALQLCIGCQSACSSCYMHFWTDHWDGSQSMFSFTGRRVRISPVMLSLRMDPPLVLTLFSRWWWFMVMLPGTFNAKLSSVN